MINKINEILNNPSDQVGFYREGSVFAASEPSKRFGVYDAVTYRQFSELIKVYYRILAEKPDQKIILYTKDSFLFMVGFFASLLSGKEVFMPNYYQQDSEKIFGADFTLTDLPDIGSKNLVILSDNPAEKPFGSLPKLTENALMSFCTSGSTGSPKVINKRFANMISETVYLSSLFGDAIAQRPLFVTTVNINHMYGIFYNFLIPLYNGLSMLTDMVVTTDQLNLLLSEKKLFIASSPAFLERLAKYEETYNFPQNTVAISTAGGPLKQSTAEVIYRLLGIYYTEIFGSTETGGIAYRFPDKTEYWTLYSPVEARANEEGLLEVSGASVDSPFLLADKVEFINERQFILKGRSDRIVKFEEKRVSLEEVENTIKLSGYIEDAYTALINLEDITNASRPFLGACVILNSAGKQELILKGKRAFVNAVKKLMIARLDPVCIPSKWRILEEFPKNNQGKFLSSKIALLFSENLAEPVVFEKKVSQTNLSLTLSFEKDAIYFKGHFPNIPILPGIVQVNFAIDWCRRAFNSESSVKRISKLKFSSIIKPGDVVNLSISVKSHNLYKFAYSAEGKELTSGVLHV
jgi:acyl-CoA synthetase (AMP-forming)/AMP-acid ligase II